MKTLGWWERSKGLNSPRSLLHKQCKIPRLLCTGYRQKFDAVYYKHTGLSRLLECLLTCLLQEWRLSIGSGHSTAF